MDRPGLSLEHAADLHHAVTPNQSVLVGDAGEEADANAVGNEHACLLGREVIGGSHAHDAGVNRALVHPGDRRLAERTLALDRLLDRHPLTHYARIDHGSPHPDGGVGARTRGSRNGDRRRHGDDRNPACGDIDAAGQPQDAAARVLDH